MQPFTTLTAPAVPLPMANVDTDQLIPARFMRKSRADGYGAYLLYDVRFNEEGKPRGLALDDRAYAGAEILIAGRNFGGGSSREAAVYALADFGIRCVIAPSFGDIFTNNAVKNGLLPARVEAEISENLIEAAKSQPGLQIAVDLPNQTIGLNGKSWPFDVLDNHKAQLTSGQDDIDLTMRHAQEIADWVAFDRARRPWALPSR
ncbi:MAG: 3-isopropylmalate dehydratase small subunit [Pseudomonadota bacterium]